jgi:hypothetical protein
MLGFFGLIRKYTLHEILLIQIISINLFYLSIKPLTIYIGLIKLLDERPIKGLLFWH